MMRLFGKLKERWGVGPWGVLAILTAFSLAGMTVVRIKRPIMDALLPAEVSGWLWWVVTIPVMFVIYQIVLLIYGAILGQFGFFWKKEKALGRWLSRPFIGRRKPLHVPDAASPRPQPPSTEGPKP